MYILKDYWVFIEKHKNKRKNKSQRKFAIIEGSKFKILSSIIIIINIELKKKKKNQIKSADGSRNPLCNYVDLLVLPHQNEHSRKWDSNSQA